MVTSRRPATPAHRRRPEQRALLCGRTGEVEMPKTVIDQVHAAQKHMGVA